MKVLICLKVSRTPGELLRSVENLQLTRRHDMDLATMVLDLEDAERFINSTRMTLAEIMGIIKATKSHLAVGFKTDYKPTIDEARLALMYGVGEFIYVYKEDELQRNFFETQQMHMHRICNAISPDHILSKITSTDALSVGDEVMRIGGTSITPTTYAEYLHHTVRRKFLPATRRIAYLNKCIQERNLVKEQVMGAFAPV